MGFCVWVDDLSIYVLSNSIQSYQEDGVMIMKSYVQWNPVYGWNDYRLKQVSIPGPLDQQARAEPTELPGLSRVLRLKIYLVVLLPAFNPARSSPVIYSFWVSACSR